MGKKNSKYFTKQAAVIPISQHCLTISEQKLEADQKKETDNKKENKETDKASKGMDVKFNM